MTSPRKGYIFYIESTNTRSFIRAKLLEANCDLIYEQTFPHDSQTLRTCLQELNPGETLVLWRVDKTIPKYHNKVTWLTDILARDIRIISLADMLTL